MALGTRVRVSHGIRHAIIGSLSSVVGVFVAFGVANAELPDAEFSQDPNQQVLNQIMGMMVQEKAAISALSSDRLAELSGFRVPTPAGSDAGMSSLSLFGLKLGVEQDQDAIKLAAAAQNGNLSVDLGDHSAAGFTKAVLDSMPNVSGDRQWQCLTEALYFEARSETLEGQFAVGEVILNRVDSPKFPNSVCGVVTQGAHRLNACQFSYNCDGKAEHFAEARAFARSGKLAKMLLDGRARVLTGGATFYHASSVNPHWASSFTQTAQIGRHIFYNAQKNQN